MGTTMHWTGYISAFALPTIGLVAAWIAFRQSKIARNKLKLDLFDRRMAVYEVARRALGIVGSKGRLTNEEQVDYLAGTRPARWLFGPDLSKYFDEILWHKIVDLELYNSLSEGPAGDERSKAITARAETMKWLVSQFKEMDRLCEKYLALEH